MKTRVVLMVVLMLVMIAGIAVAANDGSTLGYNHIIYGHVAADEDDITINSVETWTGNERAVCYVQWHGHYTYRVNGQMMVSDVNIDTTLQGGSNVSGSTVYVQDASYYGIAECINYAPAGWTSRRYWYVWHCKHFDATTGALLYTKDYALTPGISV